MKRTISIPTISIFVPLLLLTAVSLAGHNWQMFKESNGIRGFKRHVDRSDFLETRSEAIVNARMEVLVEVLADVPGYPRWMKDCIESPILELVNENHRILYFAQSVPWPVTDREVVIEAVTTSDWRVGKQVTKLRSMPDYTFPVTGKKRVRMNEFTGAWELAFIDRDHTRVIYTIYSDPGGNVPASLANTKVTGITFGSMEGLKKIVTDKKYITAGSVSKVKESIEYAIREGHLKGL